MKLFKSRTIWLPTWQGWGLLFLILGVFLGVFFINAHRFLAVTHKVADADILVVEDWMPDIVYKAAAAEFQQGTYRFLFISSIREYHARDGASRNTRRSSAANRMISLNIPEDQIVECFASPTENHRSAAMAHAVRDALRQRGISTKGVTVMAPATHARKTWLVHRRALGPEVPAGIVAVDPGVYDPSRWWMSSQAAKLVINNYAGLLHEWATGY